ncbi:MAG TPA: regulatory protein RecX [Propionibacteriaceae bacterium]|nr:regulatory protein RecX [Propionibacteriaceae bacterium]
MKWPSEPPADADDTPPADPYEVARTLALRYLDRRDLTVAELKTKLGDRGVDDEVAEAVVRRFVEVGLLDDRRYAERYAVSRQSLRSLSRTNVRRELHRKGVDAEVVAEATASLDDESEYRAAHEFGERRLRGLSRHPRDVQYRRVGAALARKGFSPSLVHRVLGELLSDFPADPAAE